MRFFSKNDLEEIANKINKENYPERLEIIVPFDHYDYAERVLKLDIEWKYISPDQSILGMIFFEEADYYVWPNGSYKSGDFPILEHFSDNTIVINQILLDKKQIERERFVVNHECMHKVKDEEYFTKISKDILQICGEEKLRRTYWNSNMTEEEIVERQTNYLNAAVLMPREVIIREFFKLLRYKNIPNEIIEYKPWMKSAISKIAKGYGLNYNPVLYRLFDLKILKKEDN